MRAVLAVDHSQGTDFILSKLLSLDPAGITDVLVLSAYRIDDETAKAAHRDLPNLGADVDRWLCQEFEEKNEQLVQILRKNGFMAEGLILKGEANEVIADGMHRFKADLLIMGATGNACKGKTNLGSVALHQIAAEPYPILLVR